jgi:hypothetical protein
VLRLRRGKCGVAADNQFWEAMGAANDRPPGPVRTHRADRQASTSASYQNDPQEAQRVSCSPVAATVVANDTSKRRLAGQWIASVGLDPLKVRQALAAPNQGDFDLPANRQSACGATP